MSTSVPVYGGVKFVNAHVTVIGGVNVSAVAGKPVKVSSTVGAAIGISADEYEGEYESTPTTHAQQYETDGKLMTGDFTVLEIPTHEAPNDFGTTFTIGA